MQPMSSRLCRECWKRFWPKWQSEWVCPRCREQRKLGEWMESEAQERVIRIGACNDEMCQVVSGLDAGEHVLLEEPAAGAEAAGEAGAEASPATHD